MGDQKLCFGCFEPINDETKCPHCGYKQKSPYSPSYIAPGTIINDKYMVGKLIHYNGEGATYLGFDTAISCKVIIKEYMPDALCTRDSESSDIIVNPNSNVQYKSLMEEFNELNRKLAKLRSVSHINPVLDIFQENNTSYAVFEYIEGINLVQYLKKNGGSLSWETVMKMFPPLFTALSQVHNAGIVHRGIGPQTIYVTSRGELKLTDFCIAAVRTTKTELNAEIYKGYAAPEQYSPSSWQGTWTDVYGISSVLYRILTGCMPTESILRNESDDLAPPSAFNSDIPDNVSEAIMQGMKLSGDERIQTITELVTLIFQRSDDEKTKTTLNIGNIASKRARETQANREAQLKNTEKPERVYEQDEEYSERVYRRVPVRNEDDYEALTIFDKIKVPAVIGALALAVVIFIVILFGKFFKLNSGNNMTTNLPVLTTPPVTTIVTTLPPDDIENGFYITNVPPATVASATEAPEETTSDENSETTVTTVQGNIQMANLIGKQYEEVMVSTLSQDVKFELTYEFREDKPKGEILDQSIKEGTWIVSGEVVVLTISRGSGSGTVPDYKRGPKSCYPIKEFLELLDEQGIKYKAVPEVNTGYFSGYVIGTDPKAGAELDSSDVLIVRYTANDGNGTVIYSPGLDESSVN